MFLETGQCCSTRLESPLLALAAAMCGAICGAELHRLPCKCCTIACCARFFSKVVDKGVQEVRGGQRSARSEAHAAVSPGLPCTLHAPHIRAHRMASWHQLLACFLVAQAGEEAGDVEVGTGCTASSRACQLPTAQMQPEVRQADFNSQQQRMQGGCCRPPCEAAECASAVWIWNLASCMVLVTAWFRTLEKETKRSL